MHFDSLVPFIFFGALGFYAAVLGGLFAGLSRLRYPRTTLQPFVSVVVAARNEVQTIRRLLDALIAQEYPHYEVVIVDDRSSDGTAAIVKEFQSSWPRIRLLQVTSPPTILPSKKNALTEGIRASTGEILCFTDADCVPPPGWIRSLVSLFDESVGLVAGYSPYDAALIPVHPPSSVLQYFIRYEELKGALWSAGSIGLGLAWLCTGRNLAYRRVAWNEVGGFHEIRQSVSGDDDLFLQLLRRRTSWNIRYAIDRENHVPTIPPATIADFIRQRKRHFSAGRFFSLPMKTFFLLFHGANAVLFLALIAGIFFPALLTTGLGIFTAKLLLDGSLLIRTTRLLNVPFPAGFAVMEIFYVLYNALIGPLGFFGTFTWKPDSPR